MTTNIKLTITVGKTTLVLTPAEAHELAAELNNLLGTFRDFSPIPTPGVPEYPTYPEYPHIPTPGVPEYPTYPEYPHIPYPQPPHPWNVPLSNGTEPISDMNSAPGKRVIFTARVAGSDKIE